MFDKSCSSQAVATNA